MNSQAQQSQTWNANKLAEQARWLKTICDQPLVRFLANERGRELFLGLDCSPARLTVEQAGWRLGFTVDEIGILMSQAKIQAVTSSIARDGDTSIVLNQEERLRPLGHPRKQQSKYFPSERVRELESNEVWLDKALRTIRMYWRIKKNKRALMDNEQTTGEEADGD